MLCAVRCSLSSVSPKALPFGRGWGRPPFRPTIMKILFVASFNKGYYAPFILEQAEALRKVGCEVEFFGVTGKGIKGYLKALPALKKTIRSLKPDVVHAHYGLCGLLAGLQRKVPVVTTYHGSDINEKKVLPFSKVAMKLSKWNVFVSQPTMEIALGKETPSNLPQKGRHCSLIPCGVDLSETQLTSREVARQRMGLAIDKKYVLFAGAFDNPVKNAGLAKEAMMLIPEAELLELKGYTREQVTLLMCAADALLMTSHTEGSPQVVKEAMACGCPIVSVDVGDVRWVTQGVDGCFLADRDARNIACYLNCAFCVTRSFCGREKIKGLGLSNGQIVDKLVSTYMQVLK